MNEPGSTALWPVRGICAGIALSWCWKWRFFGSAPIRYYNHPLQDAFFPAWLQRLDVLVIGFCVPLLLGLWTVLHPTARNARISSAAFSAGSLCLLLHQGSWNDATFLTSFWVALWGVWYAYQADHTAASVAPRAAMFAQLIVALMFFGGVVGKLTPGYFDGSVLYEIYFVKRTHWSFALLRSGFSPAELRSVATWYSRSVIAVEASLACLAFLPARIGLWFALFSLSFLVLLNNFQLMSVIGSLMALCAVALGLLRTAARSAERAAQ